MYCSAEFSVTTINNLFYPLYNWTESALSSRSLSLKHFSFIILLYDLPLPILFLLHSPWTNVLCSFSLWFRRSSVESLISSIHIYNNEMMNYICLLTFFIVYISPHKNETLENECDGYNFFFHFFSNSETLLCGKFKSLLGLILISYFTFFIMIYAIMACLVVLKSIHTFRPTSVRV